MISGAGRIEVKSDIMQKQMNQSNAVSSDASPAGAAVPAGSACAETLAQGWSPGANSDSIGEMMMAATRWTYISTVAPQFGARIG